MRRRRLGPHHPDIFVFNFNILLRFKWAPGSVLKYIFHLGVHSLMNSFTRSGDMTSKAQRLADRNNILSIDTRELAAFDRRR